MPYLSGKGIRDLYYIKIARLGYRKEGQELLRLGLMKGHPDGWVICYTINDETVYYRYPYRSKKLHDGWKRVPAELQDYYFYLFDLLAEKRPD